MAIGSYYLQERNSHVYALKTTKDTLARISLDTPRPNPQISALEKYIKKHKANIRGSHLVIGICLLTLIVNVPDDSISWY